METAKYISVMFSLSDAWIVVQHGILHVKIHNEYIIVESRVVR